MANDNGGDGERGIILPFATREEQAKKRAGEISATEEELRNFDAKAVKMLEQLRADRRITRDLVESYAEQLKTALDNPEVNAAQLTPWIGVSPIATRKNSPLFYVIASAYCAKRGIVLTGVEIPERTLGPHEKKAQDIIAKYGLRKYNAEQYASFSEERLDRFKSGLGHIEHEQLTFMRGQLESILDSLDVDDEKTAPYLLAVAELYIDHLNYWERHEGPNS